ncbi:hypothetical protein [Sphaerimonospora thailandensis]|uniref:Uncharacterized protein n=1 Tax=Sphaerimonospora thailandensis TaxID=795644 RepID=A0A8J3RBV3_9ACTN|nr:hypothetical protein [Sphaerimonospora thailandensis]GIH73241.1 hypothetical protein Mth01_54940 [Sphaerimonospora thailandensis]
MPSRIEGKVAQILTARELVINKGTVDGVEVGMRFAVLNSRGVDIKDPDTGEALGSVEIEKAIVKVVRVSDRLAVARTFRTYRIPGGSFYLGSTKVLEQMMRPPRTEIETLQTDERRLKDELDESGSYIKKGDPVVQVIGDEFDQDDSQ